MQKKKSFPSLFLEPSAREISWTNVPRDVSVYVPAGIVLEMTYYMFSGMLILYIHLPNYPLVVYNGTMVPLHVVSLME